MLSRGKGDRKNADTRLTALTRIGFAARGQLYIVIAFLILRSGRAEDSGGAIEYLGRGGGQLLLAVIAAGLTTYGTWRLAGEALDIQRHDADRKGVMERVGAGVSDAIHLLLAWQATQLLGGWALVLVGAAVLVVLAIQVALSGFGGVHQRDFMNAPPTGVAPNADR